MYRSLILISLLALPTQAAAKSLSEYLSQSGSHASITLDLPFDAIEAIANSLVEKRYSGRKDDPTDALKSDELTWYATLEPITVARDGERLVTRTRGTGQARISGKIGGLFPASASADLEAFVDISLRPQINPDWSVAMNASGSAKLSRADLRWGSIRGLLQPALDREVGKALNAFNTRFSAAGFLKDEVRGFWNDICHTRLAEGNVTIVPDKIAATQPVIGENAAKITVVVSGDISTIETGDDGCPSLPDELLLLE